MEENELLTQLKEEISDLKKLMLSATSPPFVSDKWLPRARVMEFLDYGDTQMAAFEKSSGIVVSRIGKRKFFHRDSIEKILNNHLVKL
jgi:hypothetical protein